jgi:hypothetical protein
VSGVANLFPKEFFSSTERSDPRSAFRSEIMRAVRRARGSAAIE